MSAPLRLRGAPLIDRLEFRTVKQEDGCWHLEPVTNQINTLRSPIAVAAVCARKTHCPQNHPYDEANTIILRNGYRRCRTCKRDERRRSR